MKLPAPFFNLRGVFDVDRLRAEARSVPEKGWQQHNTGFAGNSACLLVRPVSGDPEGFYGQLEATPELEAMPYTESVLRSFRTVIGRARLMRLAPGCDVPKHSDVNYYWRHRTRVHVPIQTDRSVIFHCGKDSVHMAPGEAWIFDNWRQHRVENNSLDARIHLVFDTVGTAAFWEIVKGTARPQMGNGSDGFPLLLENVHKASVLSHYAVDQEMNFLSNELHCADPSARELESDVQNLLHDFAKEWHTLSMLSDPVLAPRERHIALLKELREMAYSLPADSLRCSNGASFSTTLTNYFDTLSDAVSQPLPVAA